MDNKNPDFSVGAALMQSIIAKAIMESSPLPSGAVDNSRPQYLKHSDSGQVATVENGAWTKVAFLKEGMEIAVSDQGDNKAVWDGIAKIEILPAEQVYDIEVEGTHNFIGNDIVAHNTYIGGTASTTNLIVSGTAYLGSLNGPLQANNGLVSATTSVGAIYGGTGLDSSALTGIAQIVSGTWSASSTLSTAFGGTGWGNIQSNSILLGNGAGRLATTSAGTDGYTLALVSGIPTWVATSTLSTITGTLAVAKGGTGQTSFGQGWLNSDGTTLSASTSPTVNYIVATSTSATSTFPYLSVTTNSNLGTVVGGTMAGNGHRRHLRRDRSDYAHLGNVLVGNGTSAITSTTTANLKATLALNNVENTALTTWAGSTNLTTLGTIGTGVWNGTTIAVANGGTGLTSGYNNTNWDTAYTNRITSATYPLQISSNVISTALGTTTSNTWAGTQTFGAISNTGGYTQSGTTANTFTGTPTFSNATYSALFTGGNVGIGTASPGSKLQIGSVINMGADLVSGNKLVLSAESGGSNSHIFTQGAEQHI